MKIVHLNANSAGGAFVAANRLSAALNETGKVDSKHLVFSGQEGQGYSLWANSFLRKKWALFQHAKEKLEFLAHEKESKFRFAFSHASAGIRVCRLPEVMEADIVHLHWVNKGFISLNGLEELYASGKKIVWTAHDLWPFTGGCYHPRGCSHLEKACGQCPYLKRPSDHDLSATVFSKKKQIYRKYNPCIVVPGKWSMALASRSALSEFVRLKEIGHFIDLDVFSPAEKANGERLRILFSSMNLLNPKKGIFDLAAAINALPVEYRSRIELTLVGHAKEALPEIHCTVNQCGVINDSALLAEIYCRNDLMVIPSHEETFGLTAAEAQACGLPVLAYSAGELAYNIVHEETGWLCSTGDIQSLQQTLQRIINMNVADRNRFAMNARVWAVKKFGKQGVVDAYLDCYNQL